MSSQEPTNNVEMIPILFSQAFEKYQRVMNASRANRFTASDEQELLEGIDLLDKVLDLDQSRGEPFSLRAGLYFVYAQFKRDHSALDNAERDYKKALDVGGSDPSNHSIWRNSLEQVRMVRRAL